MNVLAWDTNVFHFPLVLCSSFFVLSLSLFVMCPCFGTFHLLVCAEFLWTALCSLSFFSFLYLVKSQSASRQ